MTHIWGINWQRYHADRFDLPHVERMQYRAVLLYEWMWDNADFCRELLAVLPRDAIVLCRDHPLSEQKQDMYTDPVGTGSRHAREWGEKIRAGRVHIPLERAWFEGINEPDSNHAQPAIDRYTEHLTVGLAQYGARCAGWVFGTGHPSTVNLEPAGPVDWHWYAASAQALQEYDGLANLHAYGSWNNMALDDHLCRAETCPYALRAIYGETGIDEGIVGQHGQGWKAHLSPDQYIAWLDAAQLRVRERLAKSKLDLRALCMFTYDYSPDWKSYDVQGIRPQLEGAGWTMPAYTPPAEGHTIHLPTVPADGPTPPTAEQPEPQPVPDDEEDMTWEGPAVGTAIVDPLVAEAVLAVESGGAAFGPGPEGAPRLLIRFEAHIFRSKLGNDALWRLHFTANEARPWEGQMWRAQPTGAWAAVHLGSQDLAANQRAEWAAFEFAATLNRRAALESISMGSAQVMGFNAGRIGYPSAEAMFAAFGRSQAAQLVGFVNFVLSDVALAEAIRRKDWAKIAELYNGAGAVTTYAPRLEAAYRRVAT